MYFVLNACFQHMTEAGGEYHHPHPYSMAQQYTGAPIQYNSPVASYPEYEVVQPPLYPPECQYYPPTPTQHYPPPQYMPQGYMDTTMSCGVQPVQYVPYYYYYPVPAETFHRLVMFKIIDKNILILINEWQKQKYLA